MIQNIAVYCGSSPGNKPEYIEDARYLGRSIAEKGYGLVYGGASIGLMGTVADGALENGGKVFGIIPEFLMNYEIGHHHLTELTVVKDMHERKLKMSNLADAFIALPGGFGTLEEIFETITWSQLQLHRKPTAFLNTAGFYSQLESFLDHASGQGFIHRKLLDHLIIESRIEIILNKIENYSHPDIQKLTEPPD